MSGKKRSQTQMTNLMKEELLKWLCIQHAVNAPLDRNILRLKADELVRNFELTAFKCSESWLTIFLKRYSFLPNLAESEGPVFDNYHTWINNIRALLNRYSYEDQYHLDELTMYTDFLPSSHLQHNEPLDAPVDMSTLKLQLTTPAMHQTTLLLVSNATGTKKQNPLVSAPYPVQHNEKFTYLQTEDSRISNEILSAWLFIFNRKLSETGRRVLLFMPRSRQNVLKLVRLTHVLPVFLPSKFPSNMKPLRCDVSHFIKMSYRKSYVERLCTPDGGHWTPQEITEALVDAWNHVPKELIVSSFQRTKFREDQSSLTFEFPIWDHLQTGVSFQRFVTFDDDLGDLEGPLRDDFRFLTKIKHEFNLKTSKIEGIIQSGSSEPQPSTSREFNDVQTLSMDTQRPVDDYVDDSEDDDGGLNSMKSPVIPKIKIKNEIIITGSNISQSSEESEQVHGEEIKTISEGIIDEQHVEDLSEGVNSKIDHFSSTEEAFNDKSDVIGNSVRRLFDEDSIAVTKINDSVDPEVTIESLNSLSRGESTIIEEFDSTIDDDDDDNDKNDLSGLIQSLNEPSVDSGVPDSSGETIEEKMDVDDDDVVVESSGDTSTPKIHDLSIKKEEIDDNCSGQVITPLMNIDNEDNSQEKDLNSDENQVLDTSIEGTLITAKHFVDERIEYFVEKIHQDDDKVRNDDDNDDDGSINTSEVPDAIDNDNIEKNEENFTKNDEISDSLDKKIDVKSEIEENFEKINEDNAEIHQTVDDTQITSKTSSPVVNMESEVFNPPQNSSPRPLNSSPVPDYHLDRSNCYSTESALQEASRELEEKLRDLEASDPSRKINFFDDEDTSESKQSNEAASILRDFLNEAKEFKEFSDTKNIVEDDGNINYFKGLKRRREEGDHEGLDGAEVKKQKIEDNWAKCFETFPVFGPYHFENEKKENDGETLGDEFSAQIEVKSNFEGDKGSPGPSCSY